MSKNANERYKRWRAANLDHVRLSGRERVGKWRVKNPERDIWRGMVARCLKPSTRGYANYGGRGINVCERWLVFENFIADVGNRPSPEHSIDRIDNDGDYEPKNVRWATRAEQSRNTSRVRNYTFRGETLCIADWAARLGISLTAMKVRFNRWPVEKAICSPVRIQMRWLLFRGERKNIADWSRCLGLPEGTIRNRLQRGWSVERTLSEPATKKFLPVGRRTRAVGA